MADSNAPRLLHVLNGDCTRAPLASSGVPGTLAVWADVLREGPVLDGLPAAAWRERRARYLADAGLATFDGALATATAWDAALDRFAEHDEVVLWLEHDLFDQLLLVRHLDWFGRRELGGTRLSLICIATFPGIPDFHGLGQLSPAQLATLLDTRVPVSPAQVALARRIWRAFTGADPLALQDIVAGDTAALPFLAGALRRLLQEYPALRDGLNRSERQLLEAVAAGSRTLVEAFRACAVREERVFMGDASFWRYVRELAAPPAPLLVLDDAQPVSGRALPDGTLRLTETGRQVLAGRDDRVRRQGLDRWIGGVHLVGSRVGWRWNDAIERLARTQA